MSNRIILNGRERIYCVEHPFVTGYPAFGATVKTEVFVEAFPNHHKPCAACNWAGSLNEWNNWRSLAVMSGARARYLVCPENCAQCRKGK